MDKYIVGVEEPKAKVVRRIKRGRWKRTGIEINGRIESKYKRQASELLVQSYSQTGVFPHEYHSDGAYCPTHYNRAMSFPGLDPWKRHGISALDFDKQGIYLVSVTKSGCLTVHDFDSLYCQSKRNVVSPGLEDETKLLLHIPTFKQLDSVRWNPVNQDEVACTSLKSKEVKIFDIRYVSSDPVEILTKKPSVTIHGSDSDIGLSDVVFSSSDNSRVFATDTSGSINIWDRRRSLFPSFELRTNPRNSLNSIQLNVENQMVFGAGKQGLIYMWDLRGGRTTAAFQSHNEAYHLPVTSVKVSSLLEKIESLKAQSDIEPKDIHSINLDPSSAYRLAFHLDDGWSGILDIHNLAVTHIHCPPPAWLTSSDMSSNFVRKPSWLSSDSIYAVGSSSERGLHLLDFYPDPSSPCHVDCSEDVAIISQRNGFIPLSYDVSACVAHPLNGYIVAGTKQASLLLIGQQNKPLQDDDEDQA